MSSDSPLAYRSRPPDDSSSGPAPAVVLIHGRGADETDLLPIATQLPDQLHVFSVRAPLSFEDGYAWYHLDVEQGGLHESQPDPESLNQSVLRLAKLLAVLVDEHNIDPNRIGLLGFSQGGTLAVTTAIEVPDRVAWVVALHAFLPQSHRSASKLVDARGIPMFFGAGEMDLVVPEERTERASTRLGDVGIDVTYRAYAVGHGANDAEIDDVARWVRSQLSD